VTDIGIELGKLFYWNSSSVDATTPFVLANRAKLKVHGTMLTMFFVGASRGRWDSSTLDTRQRFPWEDC
jgi:hypothetical protein